MSGAQIFLLVLLAIVVGFLIVSRKRVPGWWDRSREFLFEVRGEMRKVAWPTKDEMIGNTVVVLVSTIAVSVLIGTTDTILSWIVRAALVR